MGREGRNTEAPGRLTGAFFLLALLLATWTTTACSKPSAKSPDLRDVVEDVSIFGLPTAKIEGELPAGLGTQGATHFLWSTEYSAYDETVLEQDLQRIERELQRRGYYEASVSVARIIRQPEIQKKGRTLHPVRVELRVQPGPPIVIRELRTEGLAALPFTVAEAATHQNRLREGRIFDENEFEQAKLDIAGALADRGYAFAEVTGKAQVDLVQRTAMVTMTAEPGPRTKLGEVTIGGLQKVAEDPVRRILHLQPGQWYSRETIRDARSALIDLGVFSRVEIVPDFSRRDEAIVPLEIRLEESTLRELSLGGGVRLDLLRLAVTGQAKWTHRNFLGGLRKFSIETRPGLTFFPTNTSDPGNIEAPTNVLPENFATIRLEQPGLLESRTKGFIEYGYNIYPLLYPRNASTAGDPRDERVIGYQELTSAIGAQRLFFDRILDVKLALNWQANFPFEYQKVDGVELINVQVTYPELVTSVDFRDDPLMPTEGVYFSNSLQVATQFLGSDLQDVRIHPELRTFVPLDKRHRLVLASRLGIGMLFPFNYGEAISSGGADIDYADPEVNLDQQRLVFRALYSGGPGSNRGYPFRQVGPQGLVTFLLPSECQESLELGRNPSSRCLRPLGGFSLWEASTELRWRFLDDWAAVAFVDASDVSTQIAHFTLRKPHVAVGPGLRYISPVGPIRLDLGWRVPGLQKIEGASDEPQDVADVAPYSNQRGFFQRFALHILIGEDF